MQIPIRFETFAIKSLKGRPRDARHFESEVEMLKRFNGHVHPHLVTLLASFTHMGINNLIFPWAECDLFFYWEDNEAPSTADDILWLSGQVLGLATALNLIHNPPWKDDSTRKYARHGDLKPENILWFKSINDSRGILVITDLGLASINSKKSRSLTRNDAIAFTPAYRPPECDIEDGYISRSFDIWSLGCLLLEMISWMLGGWELVESFSVERMTPNMTGSRTDTFFDIVRVADPQAVNQAVTGESSAETDPRPHEFRFEVKKQVTAVCRVEKLIHELLTRSARLTVRFSGLKSCTPTSAVPSTHTIFWTWFNMACCWSKSPLGMRSSCPNGSNPANRQSRIRDTLLAKSSRLSKVFMIGSRTLLAI